MSFNEIEDAAFNDIDEGQTQLTVLYATILDTKLG